MGKAMKESLDKRVDIVVVEAGVEAGVEVEVEVEAAAVVLVVEAKEQETYNN